MREELVSAKIGCYTHSSDFRVADISSLPGVRWNKNYICHPITLERPTQGIQIYKFTCPVCHRNLILKVPSRATATKKRILFGSIGITLVIAIVLLLSHDFGGSGLSDDLVMLLKIQATFWGGIVALSCLANSYSKWFCYNPKVKKDFTFAFIRHKLFH